MKDLYNVYSNIQNKYYARNVWFGEDDNHRSVIAFMVYHKMIYGNGFTHKGSLKSGYLEILKNGIVIATVSH